MTIKKLQTWLRNYDNWYWFAYAGLSLLVLFPLLLPGYVLTLDLVFTPHIQWPGSVTSEFPLRAVLWGVNQLLPGDIVEKLVLFAILFCSGVGAYRLITSLKVDAYPNGSWRLGAYVAGVFYMINPFTYSRFMAGQWMVLLGYALLPFFVRVLFAFIEKPSYKKAVTLGVIAAAVMAVSIHFSGMIVVVSVIAWVLADKHRMKSLRYISLSIATTIVLTSYWWIPMVVGKSDLGAAVAGFNGADFDAFATSGGGAFGPIGAVLRLQGFWVEARGFYLLPQDWVPAWGLVFLAFWALVTVGAVRFWRVKPLVVRFAICSIGLGTIVAATPVIRWSSQWLPFVAGYREPHKFAALIALGYAVLAAFGAIAVAQSVKKGWSRIIIWAVLISLPIILTPTMLWGFGGQLQPRQYPSEWQTANVFLKRGIAAGEKTLVLPWHQYSEYHFTDRIIANPAELFFEVPTVISDDPEFKQVSPTVPNDDNRRIEAALHAKTDLFDVLKRQNIRFIVLLKDQDYDDYTYLDGDNHLKKIQDNGKLSIYQLEEQ